jgi:hypothetical protein
MFLDNSRYAKVAQDTVQTRTGRSVAAIRLRPLPPTTGDPYMVLERDRLDLLAQARYADGTQFWHIADANTDLDARRLTDETGAVITLPRS